MEPSGRVWQLPHQCLINLLLSATVYHSNILEIYFNLSHHYFQASNGPAPIPRSSLYCKAPVQSFSIGAWPEGDVGSMLCRLQQISIAPFFSWHICSDLLILILCPSIVLKLPAMIVRANLRSILYSVHIQFLDSFQDILQIMFNIEEIDWEITKYLSTYRMKCKVLVRYKPANSKSFKYVSNYSV